MIRWRWDRPLVAALVLLHGVLAWVGRAFSVNTGNDDAAYLLLSRSLRHFSYADAHIVGAPVHSQYPPGFPAFLATLSPIGEHFDVYIAAIVLCSMIALAFVWDIVRRRSGSVVGLTVLALCAVNPSLVRFAGSLMSETLYMLLTVLTVWAVTREQAHDDHGSSPFRWPLLAISAACCAALTRSIGVTLLGALFLYFVFERRYRGALVFGVAASITFGSWMAWTILAPDRVVGRSYIADATFVGGNQPGFLGTLIDRMSTNVPAYVSSSLPTVLPQPTLPGTSMDNAVGILLLTVFGVVGSWFLWRRSRLVVLYLGVYAALLAVWAWGMTRFLVPLIPFVIWMLIAGAFALAERYKPLRVLPFVVAAAIAATALVQDARSLRKAWRCDRGNAMTSDACYSPVQRAFFAALEYLRRSTPDTAVVLSVKEGTIGYLAGRRVLMHETVDARDAQSMLADLRGRGADYILLTPLRIAPAQHLPVLLQLCREFEVEAEFAPATLLLRFPPASEARREGACEALQRYDRDNVAWDPAATARGT